MTYAERDNSQEAPRCYRQARRSRPDSERFSSILFANRQAYRGGGRNSDTPRAIRYAGGVARSDSKAARYQHINASVQDETVRTGTPKIAAVIIAVIIACLSRPGYAQDKLAALEIDKFPGWKVQSESTGARKIVKLTWGQDRAIVILASEEIVAYRATIAKTVYYKTPAFGLYKVSTRSENAYRFWQSAHRGADGIPDEFEARELFDKMISVTEQ